MTQGKVRPTIDGRLECPAGVVGRCCTTSDGERPERTFVIRRRQTKLLDIIHALDSSRRLASRLNGGQQQTNQHRDDRDDD